MRCSGITRTIAHYGKKKRPDGASAEKDENPGKDRRIGVCKGGFERHLGTNSGVSFGGRPNPLVLQYTAPKANVPVRSSRYMSVMKDEVWQTSAF